MPEVVFLVLTVLIHVVIKMQTLVTKDTKDKLRFVKIWCDYGEDKCVIHRITSQLNGKETIQPEIVITKGKAGRTVLEQAKLEYDSRMKKYLDKGYKEIPESVTDIEEIKKIVGSEKTGQGGILKPMLAKPADSVASKIFDKDYYASRKINGVRALIYFKDGEIHTASRGSITYDSVIPHIIKNPKLIEFFNNHPNAVLDGEIYRHGWTLNVISGKCRASESEPELQFYWYDIVDLTKSFSERLNTMFQWSNALGGLLFEPQRVFKDGELAIQFVPQDSVSGWFKMKKLHDKFIQEGWEGLVIRRKDSYYKPGGRSSDMIKIKEYFDDTFKVVGYELGLRGSEDMTFICLTKDGQKFKASPFGDRQTKEEYIQNFDEKYKNQYGDCKYFEISPYGIPQQPKFIAFRYDV